MVTSWILNSLSKDLADGLQYVSDAKELWQELEDIYDQTNRAKLYQLQKEIKDLNQGTLDITGYYTKMKRLWEELNTLNAHAQCGCQCTCGAKEEKQREIRPNNRLVMESTSLNVNGPENNKFRTNYNPQGNTARQNSYRPAFPLIDQSCIVITFTRGRNTGYAANIHGQCEEMQLCINEDADSRNHNQNLQNLTKEQYNQLLSLLENFKINNAGESEHDHQCNCQLRSGATNHMTYRKSFLTNIRTLPYPFLVTLPNGHKVKVTEIGDALLSPKLTLFRVLYVPSFKYNHISIHSLTGHHDCMVNFNKYLCLMKGPSMKRPLEIGKARNGLYFLCSKYHNRSNLSPPTVSIPSQSHSCVSISDKNASSENDQIHPSYSLPTVNDPPHSLNNINSIHSCNKTDIFSANSSPICSASSGNNVDYLWHNSLGHVPFVKMRKISALPVSFAPKQPFVCSICPMARQTRLPFPERTTSSTKIFELLHVDIPSCCHPISKESNDYGLYDENASISVTDGPVIDTVAPVSPPAPIHLSSSLLPSSSSITPNQSNNFASQPLIQVKHSDSDHSLFYKKLGNSTVFVAVHVDDIILTGTNLEKITELNAFLHNQFRIKNLGKLHYFLGLEMLYKGDGVMICQRKFTMDLLKELIVWHTLLYLKKDPTLGIFLSNDPDYNVSAYCDSDWAAYPGSKKSLEVKKQTTVSLSSAEAEYRSIRKVMGELVWIKRLLEELTVMCTNPITVFCDSQAVVHIARIPVFHEMTKHIEVDCHFVRNKIQEGLVKLHHISTSAQLVDILTKALTGVKHSDLLSKLAVTSSPPTGGGGIENN
ncbi:uncharacterized protein [Nicotiana sylvestris]|uniref:uncharacterized protein n=1 Tax=Nicotiana sylvestris TaxID=4096 RepID=UPI00388C8CBE